MVGEVCGGAVFGLCSSTKPGGFNFFFSWKLFGEKLYIVFFSQFTPVVLQELVFGAWGLFFRSNFLERGFS